MRSELRTSARGFWLLAMVLALIAAAKPVFVGTLDPDFFWHILVARQLQAEGIHPLIDHLSFTTGPGPWVPYSWLAELIMRRVWESGGYRLVLALQSAMTGAIVLFLAAIANESVPRSASRARLAAGVSAACCTIFTLPWITFRPAAMVILLLAAGMWLLKRDYRRRNRSPLVWLVIPIAAIAVRMHLFAFLLPGWVGIFLIASLLERAPRRNVVRYAILLAGVTAACICTPMFPGIVRTLFYYQFSDPAVSSGLILEMQPIGAGAFGKVLLLLLAMIAIVLCRQRRSVGILNWLLLGAGTMLLVQHGRYAPLFAISLASPLTMAVTDLSDVSLKRRATCRWLAVASALCAAVVGVDFPRPSVHLNQWFQRRSAHYPIKACSFVAAYVPPHTGRLLDDFTSGGYIEWRLHREFEVFVDGRTQVRPPAFWKDAYFSPETEVSHYLQGEHADAALLTPASPFLRPLLEDRWHEVYLGKNGIVLLPPHAAETLAIRHG